MSPVSAQWSRVPPKGLKRRSVSPNRLSLRRLEPRTAPYAHRVVTAITMSSARGVGHRAGWLHPDSLTREFSLGLSDLRGVYHDGLPSHACDGLLDLRESARVSHRDAISERERCGFIDLVDERGVSTGLDPYQPRRGRDPAASHQLSEPKLDTEQQRAIPYRDVDHVWSASDLLDELVGNELGAVMEEGILDVARVEGSFGLDPFKCTSTDLFSRTSDEMKRRSISFDLGQLGKRSTAWRIDRRRHSSPGRMSGRSTRAIARRIDHHLADAVSGCEGQQDLRTSILERPGWELVVTLEERPRCHLDERRAADSYAPTPDLLFRHGEHLAVAGGIDPAVHERRPGRRRKRYVEIEHSSTVTTPTICPYRPKGATGTTTELHGPHRNQPHDPLGRSMSIPHAHPVNAARAAGELQGGSPDPRLLEEGPRCQMTPLRVVGGPSSRDRECAGARAVAGRSVDQLDDVEHWQVQGDDHRAHHASEHHDEKRLEQRGE